MNFFKRMPIFLFALFSLWYAGLFGYFNLERIKVEMPYIGTFNIAIALTVLGSFITGALFATVFFGFDSIRKSLKVAAKEKKIRQLESETASPVEKRPEVVNDPVSESESEPIHSVSTKPEEDETSLPKTI